MRWYKLICINEIAQASKRNFKTSVLIIPISGTCHVKLCDLSRKINSYVKIIKRMSFGIAKACHVG